MSRTTLLLTGGLLAIGAALTFIPVAHRTNCGGNSAALSQVHTIALIAKLGAADAPNHSFRFTTPTAEERDQLSSYSRTHWIHTARFLVSTNPVSEHEAKQRRIIVVCDTPYRNVPRQWIGSAPPAHAAGYSDGSYGLISTDEFTALDRSTFRPLDELHPPKSK